MSKDSGKAAFSSSMLKSIKVALSVWTGCFWTVKDDVSAMGANCSILEACLPDSLTSLTCFLPCYGTPCLSDQACHLPDGMELPHYWSQ